jgi:hypothetical protein
MSRSYTFSPQSAFVSCSRTALAFICRIMMDVGSCGAITISYTLSGVFTYEYNLINTDYNGVCYNVCLRASTQDIGSSNSSVPKF